MTLSHRRDELPPDTIHFIHYSNFVWTQLKALLWTLLRPLPQSECIIGRIKKESYDYDYEIVKNVLILIY
jgi:hypothetical protein